MNIQMPVAPLAALSISASLLAASAWSADVAVPKPPVLLGGRIVAEPPESGSYEGYELFFADEFDVTPDGAPNPEYWDYDVTYVRNQEKQCYTDNRRENVRLERRTIDGVRGDYLVLELRPERFSCPQDDGNVFEYTSGAVTTRARDNGDYLVGDDVDSGMPFGIYEIRAKIPSGRGTWPALWLVGHREWDRPGGTLGWPDAGEIDIMEAVGFEEASGLYRLHSTLHRSKNYQWPNQRGKTGQGMIFEMNEPPSARFHVWKMIWEPDSIEIFVDNQRVSQMDVLSETGRHIFDSRDGFFRSDPAMNAVSPEAWPFSKEIGNEFKLIFNLAVGGGWGGQQGIDDGMFNEGPVEMLVDYVRVYTKK